MRKNFFKMMVVAGAAALIMPAAAMAEWDQSELQKNQADHDAMINVYTAVHPLGDFAYGDESAIGYDRDGNGTALLITNKPWNATGSTGGVSPWNTTPCPIQLADTTSPYTWAEAMGNCPTQAVPAGWTIGQTDKGWAEGDNEMFGPILDDLYQELTETASTTNNENGDLAFKKVDQLLDILFYRNNTAGDVYGVDGWTAENGTVWYGGLGIDQTLDQDVADISGTTGNALGAPHGTWLWNFDHMAQTFYQDFRLFDLGNSFGPNTQLTDIQSANNATKGNHTPRNRHGIELLAICSGTGACTYNTTDGGGGWGMKTLDTEDFAFFDQWVIQSLRDTYDQTYDGSAAAGTQLFTGSVALNQSYSSWMALGVPGQVCNNVNDELITDGTCVYEYKKDSHGVNKSIADHGSSHQTGDP